MKFAVRRLSIEDAQLIRIWRNCQMEFLRQDREISEDEQIRYFVERVLTQYDSVHPSQHLVGVELNDHLIAYGGLTNISWANATGEVSFLASQEVEACPAKNDAFGYFLEWAASFAFEKKFLERIYAETYSFREAHIQTLERAGFVLEGRLRKHVTVEGVKHDSLMHGMLASEFKQQRGQL